MMSAPRSQSDPSLTEIHYIDKHTNKTFFSVIDRYIIRSGVDLWDPTSQSDQSEPHRDTDTRTNRTYR